ncbi:MAG TPA: hypothetical protein VGJ15_01580 [Pirellulales bacterium]|jgi:transcriptional regulator with XRE-family HTH domain
MLSPEKVELVRQLLARGNMSQREMARFLNINRGTIRSIASGKRFNYQERQSADEETTNYMVPAVRCPGCGGMVYTPCRVCRLRARQVLVRRLQQLRRSDAARAMIEHRRVEPRRRLIA